MRIYEMLLTVAILIIVLYIGVWMLDYQSQMITKTCLEYPNETLTGELIVNCTEWLHEVKP